MQQSLNSQQKEKKLDQALALLQRDVGYALLAQSVLKPLQDRSLKEPFSISTEVSKYAHYQCDLVLVSRFAHVLFRTLCQDELNASCKHRFNSTHAKSCIYHDACKKCILQGVRLMHLCGYEYADVVLILAHASVYFPKVFTEIGQHMSPNETAHVTVLLCYLAHSLLMDETCRLKDWHKLIFSNYCTLKVLDAALFRAFRILQWQLRIGDEELKAALRALSGLPYQIPKDRVEETRLAADGFEREHKDER
jgi:hypothetical protein